MRRMLPGAALTIVTAAVATMAAAAGMAEPTGPWLTEDASAVVQVAACAPALCGTIIWSQKPVDAKGRPLCGRAVIGAMMKSGTDSWAKGWIYSPKMDNRFPAEFKLAGDGSLRLHISAGLFGKDQTWTRPTSLVSPCTPS